MEKFFLAFSGKVEKVLKLKRKKIKKKHHVFKRVIKKVRVI